MSTAMSGPHEAGILDSDGILPRVLPSSWQERECTVSQRFWFVSTSTGPLTVMAGLEQHGGRRWIHLSCARRNALPSWEDLKLVKRVICGPNRQAIQVIPRESEYVNFHPHCLHLFACIDDDPLPSFAQNGGL